LSYLSCSCACVLQIFSNPAVKKPSSSSGSSGDAHNSKWLYDMAVTEVAVAHAMSHPNIVATYRYEFKALATPTTAQECSGQDGGGSEAAGRKGGRLEVDMGAAMAGQVHDFKLYLIQVRMREGRDDWSALHK
jgi:hypothetical protein